MAERLQIITFYEFKNLNDVGELPKIRDSLRAVMRANSIKGTIILANEGFNATVCGEPRQITAFKATAETILETRLYVKSSFHDRMPFRRVDVRIKPEIVTLKKEVDFTLGRGTHLGSVEWNRLISDENVTVIDTRNEYEYRSGTFERAIDPKTAKFSDLPRFVAENLNPAIHKKIATFCTGGIRCEKFVPYLKSLGFDEVYQLEGGILKYLEDVQREDSLWRGECFVFDDRISVDEDLKKGSSPDYSQKQDRKEGGK